MNVFHWIFLQLCKAGWCQPQKCFLNYLQHDKIEVNVMFEMLSIFLVCIQIDYIFLKEFFMVEVGLCNPTFDMPKHVACIELCVQNVCIIRMYNTTYNTRPCVQLHNCACCRLQLVVANCRLRTAQPALNCQSAVGTILHHRPLHHCPSWVRKRTQCGTSFTNLMSRTGPKRRKQFAEIAQRS